MVQRTTAHRYTAQPKLKHAYVWSDTYQRCQRSWQRMERNPCLRHASSQLDSSTGGAEGEALHKEPNPALIPPECHAGAAEMETFLRPSSELVPAPQGGFTQRGML
jgi:hypothetical protein